MVDVYGAEKNGFVLLFFEWNFVSMFRLRFVVVTGQAVGCQNTYPINYFGQIVEALGIGIGLGCSHVSTHFVVMS